MNSIIDLLGLVPNTSAIVRLKLGFAGIGALLAGFVVMGIEGSALRGLAIAACGAVLLIVVVLSPFMKKTSNEVPAQVGLPQTEPGPLSTCEHEWFDPDEMLNYDPKILRCLKCGETTCG
jgi:hypothetical protein